LADRFVIGCQITVRDSPGVPRDERQSEGKLVRPANGLADDVIPKGTTLRGLRSAPGTDQRGVARPAQGETRCTIGAAEI
jgi:hypothetical protein